MQSFAKPRVENRTHQKPKGDAVNAIPATDLQIINRNVAFKPGFPIGHLRTVNPSVEFTECVDTNPSPFREWWTLRGPRYIVNRLETTFGSRQG